MSGFFMLGGMIAENSFGSSTGGVRFHSRIHTSRAVWHFRIDCPLFHVECSLVFASIREGDNKIRELVKCTSSRTEEKACAAVLNTYFVKIDRAGAGISFSDIIGTLTHAWYAFPTISAKCV